MGSRGARALAVAVTMLVVPVFATASPPNVPGAPAGLLPEGVHLAFGSDPRTELTMSWQTAGTLDAWNASGLTSQVQIGDSITYGRTVEGWVDGYEYPIVLAHHVAVDGLQPGTTYHYRVGDGLIWSDDYTVTMAPASPVPFTIGAVGDMGSDTSSVIGNALEHLDRGAAPIDPGDIPPHAGNTLRGLIGADPDLVLFLGDVSYATEIQPEWDEWFRFWEPLGARVPTMFASGNHEEEDGPWGERGFFTRVALPGNEHYYSYDYSGVHFVVLDTQRQSDPAQKAWLEADLAAAAANPDTPWIIAYLHKVPYGTGSHRSNGATREHFTPLFDAYGVDLVLGGHNHNYERTTPLRYDEQIAGPATDSYTDPGAPIYIVSGGGGISLEALWIEPQPAWSVFRELTYEYLTLDVDPASSITVTATRSDDGSLLDRVTINKDVCAAPSPPSWC